ncbi:MAG: bifunctional DNA primase/polymerase, partial [Conexivisphaerales archaeon]
MSAEHTYTAALNAGFSIFPLAKESKKPLVKWEEFMKRKPTEAEIKSWGNFENYAIVCGEVSGGLVILDFERRDDFEKFFPEWEELAKKTWVVETPHGGVHVYFSVLQNVPRRDTRIFGSDHPVDLLGEGGYAVGPGSVINHASCGHAGCTIHGITGYKFIGQPPEWPTTFRDNIEMFIRKRADKLGWLPNTAPTKQPTGARTLDIEMTAETVEASAQVLMNYWKEGFRDGILTYATGALITRNYTEQSAQGIFDRVMKLTGDFRNDVAEKIHYQYATRRDNEHIQGFASLAALMRKIGGDTVEKDIQTLHNLWRRPID